MNFKDKEEEHMKYKKIIEGVFLKDLIDFIAQVLINGKEETVHVKILEDVESYFYQELR